MGDESKEEMAGIVVSYLQGIMKEYPEGLPVRDFERKFPAAVDESSDWYANYGFKSVKHALEAIQQDVNINYNNRLNTMVVCLNPRSTKIDKDLLKLIVGQRGKKKKPIHARPSRALASFNMNRQWTGRPNYNSHYSSNRRLNQEHRADSYMFHKAPEPPRPTIYTNNRSTPTNASPYDPRASRGVNVSYSQSHSPMTSSKPQPLPARSPTLTQTPFHKSSPQPAKPATFSGQQATTTSTTTHSQSKQPISEPIFRRRVKENSVAKVPEKLPDDPQTSIKKSYIRQRLVYLLTRKKSELRLLYLKNIYKLEFEEDLKPEEFGYKSVADLMKDPQISTDIKLNVKSPSITISIRNCALLDGKENVNTEPTCAERNCNDLTKYQEKVDAIEPFNLRHMMNSLEPLSEIPKSITMISQIDEVIKYKTLRIVCNSPGLCLPLDQWEARYEQESRLRIRVRDFGFKTPLEFFKALSKESPIKVCLTDDDDWIATLDTDELREWVTQELNQCHYKAIMSSDSIYELVALPNEHYTYNDLDDLILGGCQPVSILSARDSDSMWIRLMGAKHIEQFLSIEASMTCYGDYKQKKLLGVPLQYVKSGFPCAVNDPSQQRWCRGLVLKAPEVVDKNYIILVLLVDYGITKQIAISDMLCLLKNHLVRPVGPIYSRLLGVVDNGFSVKVRSRMILQEFTNPPVKLACKFVKKTALFDNIPDYLPQLIAEVTLFDTRCKEDEVLADLINVDGESPDTNKSPDAVMIK